MNKFRVARLDAVRIVGPSRTKRFGIPEPGSKRVERCLYGCMGQPDRQSQPFDDSAVELFDRPVSAVDRKGRLAAVGIEKRVHQVIGRAQAEPLRAFQQREILEMGIGIADHEIEQDQPEEAIEIDPRPDRVTLNGGRCLLVARGIFSAEILSTRLAEDLRKILQPQLAVPLSVEAFDDKRDLVDL